MCLVCACCTVHIESVCLTAPHGGRKALLHMLWEKHSVSDAADTPEILH